MGLEFKETKTKPKRFPWEDFRIYNLINQVNPTNLPPFLELLLK